MSFGVRMAVFLAAAGLCAAQQDQELKDVRIIDGTGAAPIASATITIHNGHILSIRKTSTPATRTVMPGIINAHGHLGVTQGTKVGAGNCTRENVEAQLNQYFRYGIVAVLSLGMNSDVTNSLRGQTAETEVFSADRGFGVKGGAPPVDVPSDQVYRPDTPDEARAMVRESLTRHPDILKIWVDDVNGTVPKMKPEIYRAIIEEAHRHKLRVAAHVFYLDDAKKLVAAGLDVVAHSVRDREVDQDFIRAMKRRGVYYIPTLALEESQYIYADGAPWINDPFFLNALPPGVVDTLKATKAKPEMDKNRAAFAMAMKNVKLVYDGQVKVAFGTDSGATPMRVQGWIEHRELQLLVQAGLTPMQAIVSATRTNAELLHASGRLGIVAPGKEAKLLVLTDNPLDDIHNTTKIAEH